MVKRGVISILVALVIVIAACASPASTPAPTTTSVPTTTPTPATSAATAKPAPTVAADPFDQLYQAAKKEGELVWSPSNFSDPFVPMVSAFQKRFPGIKVTTLSILPPTVATRIITESGAGKVSLDIAGGSISAYTSLLERNLIAKYDYTGLGDTKLVYINGLAVKFYDNPWGEVYNTKLIAPADVPKTWQDLLKPAFKDKISFPTPFPMLTPLFFVWGEQKASDFITQLKAQNVNVTLGGDVSVTKVFSGEMAIGSNGMYPIIASQKKNNALSYTDFLPVSPQYVSMTLMFSFIGAPHPNAARLWMAWATTPEGLAAVASTGYGSLDPPTAVEVSAILKAKGIQMYYVDTLEKATKDNEYRQTISKLMGYVPGR